MRSAKNSLFQGQIGLCVSQEEAVHFLAALEAALPGASREVCELSPSSGDISFQTRTLVFSRPISADLLFRAKARGVEVMELAVALAHLEERVPLEPEAFKACLAAGGGSLARHLGGARYWMSRLAAVALGILLLPVIAFIAFLIRCSGRGAVFYSQDRLGLGGRPFQLWKFRTMRVDAEAAGPRWSSENDPRVTKLGRILRETHLDELPQIWNIIRGDMGFIGPRPERDVYYRMLAETIPLFSLRTAVRPGVTGLAQVREGYANSVEGSRRKLEADLYYALFPSWRMNLRILGLTARKLLPKVMQGESKTNFSFPKTDGGAMKVLFLFFCLSVPVSFAQPCAVPVCDIPAAVEEMRGANQSQRANVVKDLRTRYRGSEDVAVLENLKTFSGAARALFLEVGEEDWLVREADYLGDMARLGLIKHMIPEKEALEENFDGLIDEGRRFEALGFWIERAPLLETTDAFHALIFLGEHARRWALETKQESYFVREAEKLMNSASRAMTLIFPVHEGVFKIKMRCGEQVPRDCGEFNRKIDQLVVFDSLSSRGLIVSFGTESSHRIHYLYYTSVLSSDSRTIRSGEAPPWVRPSEAFIHVDPVTGNVSGTLQEAAYDGIVEFSGEAVRRPFRYYDDGGPGEEMKAEDAIGRYRGTFGTLKGDLVVRRFTADRWVGSFVVHNSTVRKEFQLGAFNPRSGVISLVNTEPGTYSDAKLVLARRGKNREDWTGFVMLSSGKPLAVSLRKISDSVEKQ